MRISLRELMIVVAVAAIGMAALKYADTAMLTVLQALSGVLLLALMVRACVDRGRSQAFAIGFVVCSVAYLVASTAAMTGRTGISSFGTVSAIRPLYDVVVTERWYNEANDQLAVNFQATELEKQTQRTTRFELEAWSPPPADATKGDEVVRDPAQDEISKVKAAASVGTAPGRGRGSGGGISEDAADDSQPGASRGGGRGPGGRALTAEEAAQTRRRGGRGGMGGLGPGGRGQRTSVALAELTAEQYNELMSYGGQRQAILTNYLSTKDGLAAVQNGRPLSTINTVSYVRRPSPSFDQFEVAGRCLWMLIIGYLGGLFGRFVYARRTAHATS